LQRHCKKTNQKKRKKNSPENWNLNAEEKEVVSLEHAKVVQEELVVIEEHLAERDLLKDTEVSTAKEEDVLEEETKEDHWKKEKFPKEEDLLEDIAEELQSEDVELDWQKDHAEEHSENKSSEEKENSKDLWEDVVEKEDVLQELAEFVQEVLVVKEEKHAEVNLLKDIEDSTAEEEDVLSEESKEDFTEKEDLWEKEDFTEKEEFPEEDLWEITAEELQSEDVGLELQKDHAEDHSENKSKEEKENLIEDWKDVLEKENASLEHANVVQEKLAKEEEDLAKKDL